jgi:hypothetical protein
MKIPIFDKQRILEFDIKHFQLKNPRYQRHQGFNFLQEVEANLQGQCLRNLMSICDLNTNKKINPSKSID